jgi:AcrR family transcriptional regulator
MTYTPAVRNPPSEPSERVRRLWAATDEPATRPGLSPARVVAAAVAVADAEGLGALSMARVAEHLGVSTMASYRHVRSKDALLELMADAAAGDPPEIEVAAGWRAATETWALAMAEPFAAHPWLVEIPPAGIPAGPHQVRWIETGLRALRGTGLDPGTRMQLVGLLAGHVRASIVLERDLARGGEGPVEMEQTFAADLAAVLDPDAFPELTEVVLTGAFGGVDPPAGGPAAEVVFGLAVLLDGIAALVDQAGR